MRIQARLGYGEKVLEWGGHMRTGALQGAQTSTGQWGGGTRAGLGEHAECASRGSTPPGRGLAIYPQNLGVTGGRLRGKSPGWS